MVCMCVCVGMCVLLPLLLLLLLLPPVLYVGVSWRVRDKETVKVVEGWETGNRGCRGDRRSRFEQKGRECTVEVV
jgi:hypothetical protein